MLHTNFQATARAARGPGLFFCMVCGTALTQAKPGFATGGFCTHEQPGTMLFTWMLQSDCQAPLAAFTHHMM